MLADIIAIVMGCSIPLSVIWGIIYLKNKSITLKALNSEERQVLLEIKTENADLRRRLENIETIVTFDQDTQMKLNAPNKAEEITPEMLEKLAQKLRAK